MGNNPIKYTDPDGRFSAAVFPVPPVSPTGLKWDSGKTSPIGKGFIDNPPKDISLNLPDFKSYLNFMWSVTGPGLIKNVFEWIKKSSDNKKNSAEEKPDENDLPREYKKSKHGSGKEKADDVPSWAKGNRPYKDENGKDFAKRMCDEHFGEGNWDSKSREFRQIKKWGDRGFE